MKAECWLLITAKKSGVRWFQSSTPKSSKNKPDVPEDSIPLKLSIDIPDAYFDKPALKCDIKLPEPETNEIPTKVLQGIERHIKKQLGVTVSLEVVE